LIFKSSGSSVKLRSIGSLNCAEFTSQIQAYNGTDVESRSFRQILPSKRCHLCFGWDRDCDHRFRRDASYSPDPLVPHVRQPPKKKKKISARRSRLSLRRE